MHVAIVQLSCPAPFNCSYVEEVLLLQEDLEGKLQSQFVTQQLCSMLAAHDLSDEVGR